MSKLKIGLFGVGHLGKIHLKCLHQTDYEIVGVYDPDPIVQKFVKENYSIPVFDSEDSLMNAVDVVDIVSTTVTHFKLAKKAIGLGKHAFIEKPVCTSIEEADVLISLAKKHNVKVQIGHVERYNPAIISLKNRAFNPKFIEGHRLTLYNNRGNDVSVMLDLMIHDLDLVLHIVKSEVADIQANGVCVVNDTPDICNARITFENGCVANLTASRISMKHMRKLRLFQENEYISVDFYKKESQIIKLKAVGENDPSDQMTIDTSAGKKIISIESPQTEEINAIVEELRDFHRAISDDGAETVPLEDGVKALKLAFMIDAKI